MKPIEQLEHILGTVGKGGSREGENVQTSNPRGTRKSWSTE